MGQDICLCRLSEYKNSVQRPACWNTPLTTAPHEWGHGLASPEHGYRILYTLGPHLLASLRGKRNFMTSYKMACQINGKF